MRFLISRLSSLGDVVCSLPAAGSLRSRWPEASIEWVVEARFAAVVERCEHVSRVHRVPRRARWNDLRVSKEEFDAALDLQGLLKSALYVGFSRAQRKLAYHWQREAAWLFAQPVIPDPTSFHVVDQYMDVARAAGGVEEPARFGLAPREEDLAVARRLLAEAGVSQPFVLINPGAGWKTKRWPAEHFAGLIEELGRRGVPAVFMGGPAQADREVVDEVRHHCKAECMSLAGKTTIGDLIGLLSLCAVHVGGDTGSTHLAAALGVPAVGLYSMTSPKRSCPYGQISRCLYEPAGLDRIPVSAVLRQVEAALT
jgi:lipopolysaccharide heptosyltransferase I